MFLNIQKKTYILYLIKIIEKYLKKVYFTNEELVLVLEEKKYLTIVTRILKNHFLFKYDLLSDITIIDYPNRLNRFEVVYNFLSIKRNFRIILKVHANEFVAVESLNKIYNSSNWLERECWDMFGVFFKNHLDLRRIITDYGFEGFPLRKDFPLNGYLEVRYDEGLKRVVYEPLELTQEFRFFDFKSPWDWENK
jgi:NADH/F420H2 dehydrogenase subunit C